MWGGLIGLIFLAPLLGAAIGAASGGVLHTSLSTEAEEMPREALAEGAEHQAS